MKKGFFDKMHVCREYDGQTQTWTESVQYPPLDIAEQQTLDALRYMAYAGRLRGVGLAKDALVSLGIDLEEDFKKWRLENIHIPRLDQPAFLEHSDKIKLQGKPKTVSWALGVLERLYDKYGPDVEIDILTETAKFGQIEQPLGDIAYSPGENRIKLLPENF